MGRGAWVVVCSAVVLSAGCSHEGAPTEAVAAPAPPRLSSGDERDFAAGKLAAGEAIICVADGLTIDVAVPKPRKRSFVTSKVAWEKDGSHASLRLDVRPTGRVVASCS